MHRAFLKIMLWLLAASAAAGVLAIFLSTRVMGRVAGTALVGAIATALAMTASRLLDDERRRLGGLIGLGAIVLSFVLALAAIWVDVLGTSWWDVEWQLAGSAILVCVGGLIAGRLAASLKTSWARVASPVALVTDVLSLAFLVGAIWLDGEEELAQTGLFTLASGGAAAAALVGIGIERRWWRWVGIAGAAAGLVMGIVGTWFIRTNNGSLYVAVMSLAVVVAHAVIVLRVPLADGAGWAKVVAIGATAAGGALLALLGFVTRGFNDDSPEHLMRLAGALGIVSACATVAIVVLYRLHRRPPGTSAEVAAIAGIHLVCPHCGRKQPAPIGESACAGCGLLITVAVREPRCEKCDYPLLDLRGTICPECGTTAPQRRAD